MKHMRKAFSLILVFVLVVSLAVPAFAAETDDATVTVYATQGMFTQGGVDSNGNLIEQVFIGGNPSAHLISDYEPIEVDGLSISSDLSSCRTVYSAPSTLSQNVNVLDAIIFTLGMNGYSCTGGWDSYTGPDGSYIPGGYVHSVSGAVNYPGTVVVTENALQIDGVSYDRYSGSGWKIVVKYPNGSYSELAHYGTYYPIVDGMEIIFDYSSYIIYDVHYSAD